MPDLNTVPPSPHPSAPHEPGARQTPGSPSLAPLTSDPLLHILPSNQNAVNPSAAAASSSAAAAAVAGTTSAPSTQFSQPPINRNESGVGQGPGPLRHPRPLTASELHAELEKEQELVVNRLSRELTMLRAAQNASVVSSTSSTSATTHEAPGDASLLGGSGFTIPNPREHHRRTSSTASLTFANQTSSSYDGRRPSQTISMSRQNSTQSRTSQAHSPAASISLDPSNYFQQQRIPPNASSHVTGSGTTPHSTDQMSPGLIPTTLRYEEVQHFKQELDLAKRENEMLRKRVIELERQVRVRRASDASQALSDGASTTASMSVLPSGGTSIAGPRDNVPARPERERMNTAQSISSVGVGVPDNEVKVGESAASAGLTNNAQS